MVIKNFERYDMTLFEQLKHDLQQSRISKNSFESDTLRTLIGDIELTLTRPNNKTVDDVIQSTLTSFVKNARTFIGQTTDETIKSTKNAELAIYSRYMPVLMSFDEIKAVIVGKFGDVLDVKQKGPIMAFLKANHPGKYDGLVASQVIASLIV